MIEPVPIAVIGMACRFPGGANSPEELWDLLREGRSGWGKVPTGRWNAESFYHPEEGAKESSKSKAGYFLQQDISHFDAKFFNIVPYEAHTMDPQQRILLETTYQALENAGISLEALSGSDTSVFVGIFARDYDRMGYKDLAQASKQHATGAGDAILSNRISYIFNLKGASMTIDTGCSASMSALHQACLTLRAGESRVSIVSGAELLLTPDQTVIMSAAGMCNPDGRCYVFDDRGAGYSRGEGVGTLILKRLDAAIKDGDTVHAVILNSALNQDGKTPGITLPNPDSQASLMKHVYESVGAKPAESLYVEAHGTGTVAGDNAEISSIHKAFCDDKTRITDLYVGSIKSSIGHLEAASCMAGMIKSIMILKNGLIPPQLEFVTPKPGLKLEERRIKVPQSLIPLVPSGYTGPKRVSVNSFGYGGTNGHVLLEAFSDSLHRVDVSGEDTGSEPMTSQDQQQDEEQDEQPHCTATVTQSSAEKLNEDRIPEVKCPPVAPTKSNGDERNGIQQNGLSQEPISNGILEHHANGNGCSTIREDPALYLLTAHSDTALQATANNLLQWLTAKDRPYAELRSLAYTLNCRRSMFSWRRAIVASSTEELKTQLAVSSKVKAVPAVKLTFVFTGQGAQWYGMGRELLMTSSHFKNSILASDKTLRQLGAQWSLEKELTRTEAESRISESEISQPSTTAIQIALVDLLRHVGVQPSNVVGHSSGEIAAAYAAGALTHHSAIKISYFRGVFSNMAKHENGTPGSMLAVGLSLEAVAPLVKKVNLKSKGRIQVGCINSPESVTVTGDEPAIDDLDELLKSTGTFSRKLKVDTAYHSHHMAAVSNRYLDSLQDMSSSVPREDVGFVSSVTGRIKSSGFSGAYWAENLISPVRFSDAVTFLAQSLTDCAVSSSTANVFLEIGPHSALQGPLKQTLRAATEFKHHYISCLVRGKDAHHTLLNAIGSVFELGANMNLEAVTNMHHSTDCYRNISDLAPYPFDHGTKYWRESRLSRDHRLRQFPYHDIVGVLDPHSNVLEPRWRYHLNPSSQPWLKHHKVDGMIIFPGAGYLSMAIEAMKQLSILRNPSAVVSKFMIRNVAFLKPIVVPVERSDGFPSEIEVQLVISPSKVAHGNPWETFRVYSYSEEEDSWSEHCSGSIRTHHQTSTTSDYDVMEGTRERELANVEAQERLERIMNTSSVSVDVNMFYSNMQASGNEYGPTFSSIDEIKTGKLEGYVKQIIPDIPSYMPSSFMQPHIIHPSTLDTFSHLACMLYKRECKNSPLMLASIGEVVVSTDISSKPGDELLVATQLQVESRQSANGNCWVYGRDPQTNTLSPVCTVSNIEVRSTGEEVKEGSYSSEDRSTKYQLSWDEDVDFMTNAAFGELMTSAHIIEHGAVGITEQSVLNEKAAAIIIDRCLASDIMTTPRHDLPPHFFTYYQWMKDFAASEVFKQLLTNLETEDAKDALLQQAAEGGVEGKMLIRIGQHMGSIFKGEVEPLDVMLRDDLLNKVYAEGPVSTTYPRMGKYLEALAFKKPHMRILEVGAGTGGVTPHLLQALDREGTTFVDRYHYTDISSGFFAQAKVKFKNWKTCVDFKPLDITQDPLSQGYELHSYDLVIASNVLHATPSIVKTLEHIRKLLKTDGRMLLLELTRKTASLATIFGVLPGWWAFEDGRESSPLLTEDEWQEKLLQASFAGIEHVAHDIGDVPTSSMMVIKAADAFIEELPVATIKICTSSGSDLTRDLNRRLCQGFEAKGFPVSNLAWNPSSFDDVEKDVYIILENANDPILSDPSKEEYDALKSLLTKCRSLLWVSFREADTAHAAAMQGLITGLARVVRRENDQGRVITLDVKDVLDCKTTGSVIDAIFNVSETSFWPKSEADRSDEDEYALKNGRIEIPRIHANSHLNHWEDRMHNLAKAETCQYQDPDLPIKLEVETPGLLSSLRFVHDAPTSLPLAPDEIQVQALAYGVNFRDVFIALGQMPAHLPMAGEVCGMVTAVGSAVDTQSKFKIGDRVAGMSLSPYSSYPRLKSLQAQVVPESISSAVAASIPVVYLTAYYCLVDIARLHKGQTILIHSASGGVGQAAVRIAQYIGAEILVTVGSSEKRKFIINTYGIPESHIFSSRSSNNAFKQGIMRLTAHKGVDVVLNSLAGQILADSWECLAEFGTHVEIGKADIYKKSHLSMTTFDKSTTFAAVDLLRLFQGRAQQMWENLGKIFDLVQQGVLAPVQPLNTLPIDQIETAFRLISDRKHIGKVVLEINKHVQVSAILPPPSPLKLDPDGTYIIAGGLGDLGQRLCRLLASRSAGHIVTLSRRSVDDATRSELQESVRELGGQLYIEKCDVTDRNNLEIIAEKCRQALPPVKGIIHAGMVLRDRPFVNMEFEDYKSALGPKVMGTMNLAEAFCSDKSSSGPDFFITLSSLTCIRGSPGQANYSAGCAFQDAFVRAQEGKSHTRYTTLNIGAIDGSDSIMAMPAQQRELWRQTTRLMSFEEFYTVMEYTMGLSSTSHSSVQHLMGLDRKSMLAAHGDFAQGSFARISPLFSMLPYPQQVAAAKAADSGSGADVETVLGGVKSMDEAVRFITGIIVDKFAVFLDRPASEIGLDQPFATFGMDSLVSIEIKNWMVRTFRATMQPSEVIGAASIPSLAATLASRSSLISKAVNRQDAGDNLNDNPEDQQRLADSPAVEQASTHDLACCRHTSKLERQPIPDLDEALDMFVHAATPFVADSEELQGLQRAVDDFRNPTSVGRQVYGRLEREANDPEVEHWLDDQVTLEWLKRRDPIQLTNSAATHYDGKVPHSQSERAALIATSAFRYKRALQAGTIEPKLLGMRVCTHSLQNLYNTCRLPMVGVDRVEKYVGDYCVVFRLGRAFKVLLATPNGDPVPIDEMQCIMEQIRASIDHGESWVGLLTSDGRDSWAEKRETLLAVDPRNAESLQTISAAAFVISMDEEEATTNVERMTQTIFGTGFNRWFDKGLQFVVAANGTSSWIFEHSSIDGLTVHGMNHLVQEAINSYQPILGELRETQPSDKPIDELVITTSPELDTHILLLRKAFLEHSSTRGYLFHRMNQFGKELLLAHNAPAKAIFNLVVQLASRLCLGYNVPSWEPVSLAHFHLGRIELIEYGSPAVLKFCAAAHEGTMPLALTKTLMFEAAKDINNSIQNGSKGQGFHRLLSVMQNVWPEDEPDATLFKHPVWERITGFPLISMLADGSVMDTAHLGERPESLQVWTTYSIWDNDATFSIVGRKDMLQRFATCLDEASIIIKRIIEAE